MRSQELSAIGEEDEMSNRIGIRIGIIGLGSIATYMHLPSLLADSRARIVAGCDINEYQAHRVQRQFALPQVFTDWRDLIKNAHPDAVLICLPPMLHQEVVAFALDAECHVFCEKPLGLDAEIASKLANKARDAGLVLMVGYHNRFLSTFQEARRIIREAAIGRVLQIRATYLVGGPYLSWEPKSHWYHRKESGGLLYDGGSHLFDLIHYLTNGKVVNVTTVCRTHNPQNEMPDQLIIAWQMTEGILGVAQLGWGGRTARQEIFVYGETGYLTATPLDLEIRTPRHNKLTDMFGHLDAARRIAASIAKSKLQGAAPSHYRAQMAAFLDAIEGQPCEHTSLDDAISTLRDLELVAHSLRRSGSP